MKYRELLQTNPDIFDNENAPLEIITDEDVIRDWEIERKNTLVEEGLPEEWGDIGVVYEDPYIVVLRDLVRFPSGHLGSYFRLINSAELNGGRATVILPVIDKKIVLMRQFRHSTRKWHWEVPRGFGEPQLSPEDNAIKEIREEIDGEISKLVDLGQYHNNTGIEGAYIQLFYAKLISLGKTNKDEGIVSYKLTDIKKVEEMIRDSEITDGFTIAAFTRAKLRDLI